MPSSKEEKSTIKIVSACLAGFPCRYNGSSKPHKKIIELVKAGQALPLCPEQLGGLTTPREAAEIDGEKVITINGVDVTAQFKKGAEFTLEIAKLYGCCEAILKSRSPSCDKTYGVTAKLLKENGITVTAL
ncbi:MAG: DUF523 domain-containing protein [bacterium]